LMAYIGGILAIGLVYLALPQLESLADKSFLTNWLFEPTLIITGLLLLVMVGVLAGFYPAWVLSRFKSVKVLKGAFKTSGQGTMLRKILVTIQFALSVLLLVATTIISSQLNFLRSHEKGYDSDQMLVLDFDWDGKVQQRIEYIKNTILEHPDVVSISASRAVPGDFFPNAGTTIEDPVGEMVHFGPAIYEVDDDFISNFNMTVIAGRSFSRDFPTDTTQSLMVNEAAAKLWGYDNPENIINKKFDQWDRKGKVIGVIKDFNYKSLHRDVEPLTLRHSNTYSNAKFAIKLSSKELGKTLAELEEQWIELAPHRPFLTHFVDDSFNKQYESDARFGKIFSIFSGLAIFIACLGLFGLTIYSVGQRTKEIGVRKVLGASVISIVSIMSKDFLKLYLLAIGVAIPISIYFLNKWLEDFAYRISLSWDLFLYSIVVTLLVALITMITKTIQAARANPVDSLRNE